MVRDTSGSLDESTNRLVVSFYCDVWNDGGDSLIKAIVCREVDSEDQSDKEAIIE